MKIARSFLMLLAAIGLLPWALAPLIAGAPRAGQGILQLDFANTNMSELVGRLPIVAAFFTGAVLLTYVLGRLKWAEERTKQLDTLFESGDAVVSLQPFGTDRYALIKGTCGKLVQTRGYDAAWIALTDENGAFKMATEMGHPGGVAALIEQLKRGQWPPCAHRAMQGGEPVIVRDTVSQCAGCPLQGKRYGKASVALRIGAGSKALGVMCVTAPASVVTSREEQMVLTRIAKDLSYALGTLELAGEHKRTSDELDWERSVRTAVASSADELSAATCSVPDMAKLLLEHAVRLTESRDGFAHVIDERTGVAVPYVDTAGSGRREPAWGSIEAVALEPNESGQFAVPWGEALNTREPFYRNKTGGGDRSGGEYDPVAAEALLLSRDEPIAPLNDRMLAVPALANGELMGQIVVASPHRPYTDRDLDAVVRLAEIFAVAVQRARIDHALRVREGTVASILEPVLVTDMEGVVTYTNPSLVSALGLEDARSAIGRAAGEFFHDGGALNRMIDSVASEGSNEAELRAVRADGTAFDAAATARAIVDSEGRPMRVAFTLTDLTEEKLRAETERVLWRIAEAASTTRDLGLLFRKARQELTRVMNTRNFFVALYDDEDNTISFPLFLDENDQNQFDTLPAGKTLTAYVMRKSSPVRVTREQVDALVEAGAVEVVGTRCEVWLGAPMMAEDRALGVVSVQSYSNQRAFSERQLAILAHAAAEMAPAVARKIAEAALREEQGRFGAVAETVGSALINTDSRGRIMSWNRAAESMFGYTSQEAVGQPFSLVVPEGFLQAHVDGLMRAVSTESHGYVRASVEGVGRRKDKSDFPMELSIGAWKTGEETFFTALAADVTTRKQVQEELQFLGSIPLQVSDALIVTDLNYRITYVNKAAEFLFGYAGEELIGKTLDALSAEPWDDEFDNEVHRTVSAGRIWTGALKSNRKKGTTFPVEYRISPLRDSSGRLSSYISICHDLTERVRTEQLLQTLNAAALGMERNLTPDSILTAVTDEIRKIGCSCAVFTVDQARTRVSPDFLSPGFAAGDVHTGLADRWDDIPSMPLDSFLPLSRTVQSKKSSFLSNGDSESERSIPGLWEEPERWLALALSARPTILAPLITGEDVTGVLAVQSADLLASDVPAITAFANQLAAAWRKATLMEELSGSLKELRRTQDILLRAQKMEAVGNLAGGVAHDFNNLLTAITGYAELALARIDQNDPAHADIGQIRKAAAQAASLTSQLLAFSRQTPLLPKVISVNEVVSGLDKMMRRLIGEDVELVTDLAADLSRIKADATQIQQVLMNLIINGRDAMPGGGRLTLETRNVTLTEEDCASMSDAVPGDYIRLSVTDTGTGIDPEIIDRIFEPFFTTKEMGKGTGLGLSVVYGVVSQHS
ncbi:MAG: PAS domain S-box protein, partial [Candidatus Eisenbacteria bacterium]|nr:PAS domain S-box protein [Candidatus Eisenbacteria bacterium]